MTVLIAAGIIIPIVFLLIYAAFRNFFTSARNLKEAVEGELARRRKPDADLLLSGKSVQSEQRQVVDPVSAMMAEFQAQAKKSDDAHKARIRAYHRSTYWNVSSCLLTPDHSSGNPVSGLQHEARTGTKSLRILRPSSLR